MVSLSLKYDEMLNDCFSVFDIENTKLSITQNVCFLANISNNDWLSLVAYWIEAKATEDWFTVIIQTYGFDEYLKTVTTHKATNWFIETVSFPGCCHETINEHGPKCYDTNFWNIFVNHIIAMSAEENLEKEKLLEHLQNLKNHF